MLAAHNPSPHTSQDMPFVAKTSNDKNVLYEIIRTRSNRPARHNEMMAPTSLAPVTTVPHRLSA